MLLKYFLRSHQRVARSRLTFKPGTADSLWLRDSCLISNWSVQWTSALFNNLGMGPKSHETSYVRSQKMLCWHHTTDLLGPHVSSNVLLVYYEMIAIYI